MFVMLPAMYQIFANVAAAALIQISRGISHEVAGHLPDPACHKCTEPPLGTSLHLHSPDHVDGKIGGDQIHSRIPASLDPAAEVSYGMTNTATRHIRPATLFHGLTLTKKYANHEDIDTDHNRSDTVQEPKVSLLHATA